MRARLRATCCARWINSLMSARAIWTPARTFSILMSLEPAVAAICGMLFLHEHLTAGQWVAVALVIAASAGATATARTVPTRVES